MVDFQVPCLILRGQAGELPWILPSGFLFGNPSLPRLQLRVLRSVSCGLRDQGGGVCLVLDHIGSIHLCVSYWGHISNIYIRTMGSGTAVPAMVLQIAGFQCFACSIRNFGPPLSVTVGHWRCPWITTIHGANLRSQHSALITQAKGRCAVSDI